MPGLPCSMWNLLTVACKLSAAACVTQSPDQGSNPGPFIGSTESQALDHHQVQQHSVSVQLFVVFLPRPSWNVMSYSAGPFLYYSLEHRAKERMGIHTFSPVQLLSHLRLFATPWTSACQASLSITNSWSRHSVNIFVE